MKNTLLHKFCNDVSSRGAIQCATSEEEKERGICALDKFLQVGRDEMGKNLQEIRIDCQDTLQYTSSASAAAAPSLAM